MMDAQLNGVEILYKEKKKHVDGDNKENGNADCSFLAWFSLKEASSPEDSRTTTEHEQENERKMEQGDRCCRENTQTQREEEEQKEKTEEETIRDKERAFPDVFYCPVTGKIMKDPVVHPDGTSFERGAVAADTENTYYPNRALQAIIQHEILRRNAPFRRTIDSVRRSISTTISLAAQEFDPLPEPYYCSITLDIMKNPVIDPDGHTFDRRAIVNWIKKNGNSPTTRKLVTVKQLYQNTAITDLLEEEASRDDRSIHPSILQWKEQTETEEDEDNELDLEEGDFSLNNGNNTATPLSMEEIEENRRQRRQRVRYLMLRAMALILLVIIGILSYPYVTISAVVIILIATHVFDEMQARQRHREGLAQERGANSNQAN